MYKVTKLDGRFAGSDRYKYYISPKGRTPFNIVKPLFNDWRTWCWATWGPASERDWYANVDWAWDTEHNHLRIYLRSDKQLSMFHLKWG